MTTPARPEFHKALLEQATYPAAPRKIKFEETRRSFLYRTGEHVYKIRKTSTLYSSPAIKERYAQQTLTLGRHWSGDVAQAVVAIVATAQGFALGAPGEPLDHALRMRQLPDSHWMHRLLTAGKVTPVLIGRLARFLAERHGGAPLDEKAADGGRPAQLEALLAEITYQSRKYVGQTVSQPGLDLIARPVGKFLEEHRRILVRRQKRGRIVDGHGAFVPEHLYLRGNELAALAPLDAPQKYRQLDGANDVASLVNALMLHGSTELAELFVTRYASAAKDRDVARVLPLYRMLQALRGGLVRSEWVAELPPDSKARVELIAEAERYYKLAVQTARELPRLEGKAEGA